MQLKSKAKAIILLEKQQKKKKNKKLKRSINKCKTTITTRTTTKWLRLMRNYTSGRVKIKIKPNHILYM